MKRLALMAMAATLMLVFTTKAVMAQEKAKAEKAMAPAEEKMKAEKAKMGAPTAKVLLENDRVKVNEVWSKPGNKSEMKDRPERVQYVIKGGEFRRTYPDGKTVDIKLKAGEANYNKKDRFANENVGKTEAHWIGIQLK